MGNSKKTSKKISSNEDKLTQSFLAKELQSVGFNFYRLSGYDFLHFISEFCSRLMEIDSAYIAEFNHVSNKVTIRAGIENGKSVRTSEFDIEVKPLKQILKNQYVFYPENVQNKFPEDTELKKNNIQGFAGVPLLNKDGDIIGMFYVYNSNIITNAETVETYLKIFSGRISSELNLIKKEEELLKSEKKYQALFDTAEDGIILLKGVKIVECNPKSLKIFGCKKKSELIGKTILDFSPEIQPEGSLSKDKVQRLINEKLKGKPQRFYWQHCRKDKTVFDAEVSLNPLTIEDDIHFQAIVRDITVQKKNEERLLESEERFKIIFEYAPEAIYLSDFNGKLMFGNLAAEELIGTPREELMGVNFFDNILVTEDKQKAKKALENNKIGLKSGPTEYKINTRNGQKIVEISGFPIKINDELISLGIARDITERKRSDEIIKDSEERFKIIYENAPDAMYLNDLQGRLIDGNQAAEKLIGVPKNEIIGTNTLGGIITPEDIPKAIEALELNARGLKSGPYEYKIHTKDGEKFIEVSGFPVNIKDELVVLGIARDISKQVKIENELRESENFIRSIVETSKDWIWAINLEGVHTYSNEAIKDILGYSANDILNSGSTTLIHEDDRKKVTDLLDGCITGKKGWQNLVLRWKHKNGTLRYLESTSVPIIDDKNNVTGFRGVDRDITERIEFEEKLIKAKELAEENEQKLLESQRVAKIGSFELDIKNGIYRGSDEAKRILGIDISVNSISIGEILDLVVDREKLDAARNHAFQNLNSFEMEFEVYKYDTREKITLATTARIKRDDYGNPVSVLGLVTNITEKKQIEAELIAAKERAEEHEARLLESQRAAKIGSYSLDLKTRSFKVSPEIEQIFGLDKSIDYNLDYWLSIIHPDDREVQLRYIEEDVIKNHNPHPTVYRIFNNKTGDLIWIQTVGELRFDSDNNPVELYGTGQDITEQKAVENELLRAKEIAEVNEIRFKSISENANDGITLADMEGRFIFVNRAFSKMLKYSIAELLQMKVFDLAHPDQKDGFIFNTIKEDQEFSTRRKFLCKDNTAIIAEIHGKIIEISGEKLVLGIVRDITDIVNWENDLIHAKEKAEESDKLKTAFLLNVSHEIRTPMNGILGFLNILQEPDLSEIEKSNFMEIVNKSSERLMNTINDIVEISKIETGDINLVFQEIDISEVMQFHYNFFRLEAEKKGLAFKITNQITGDQAFTKTDKHKLDSILMNILKNAVKFTDKGKIEIGNYIQNDNLFFYVSDTGRGIPDDKLQIIFERFVQADFGLNRNYEGSGIGLSIVKAHIEALNGNIQVKSEIGKGSTFLFSIPYNPTKIDIVQKQNENNSTQISIDTKVLIAEDDDVNFYLLERMLSNRFNIIRALNGEQAVNLFRDNPDVSLILMDIKMPGEFDGLEATKRIREFNKEIPIIAQTAYAQKSDRIEAIDAGCNDYISKPFNAKQLKSIVGKYSK